MIGILGGSGGGREGYFAVCRPCRHAVTRRRYPFITGGPQLGRACIFVSHYGAAGDRTPHGIMNRRVMNSIRDQLVPSACFTSACGSFSC